MHTRTAPAPGPTALLQRWLLYPLIALATVSGAALADPSRHKPPRAATYRVIQLSADPIITFVDINARGQVAFTEYNEGVKRARFYDGTSVRDLGTLGGPSATAVAVNDLGQVTGSATLDAAGTVSHAYRWSRATGMVDLFRGSPRNSAGADINNRGAVAGIFRGGPLSNETPFAFFWSPRTSAINIGTLPLDVFSFATAINDAGTVVGYSGGDGPFDLRGFRWTRQEGIRDIGTQPSEFTLASDVNEAGHIVGATLFAPNQQVHAFLWTPRTGPIDLGTGTGNRSTAVKVNDKGMVIGNVLDFPVLFHGFVWTRETGLIEIGADLPLVQTSADDVNNRGQVVGSFGGRAYVWTRAQGVVDLNTRIVGAPEGLVLQGARAISENGAIVASANTGLVLLVPDGGAAQAPAGAPVVAPIALTGTARVNAALTFSAAFTDVDLRETHTATWTWGDGSTIRGTVSQGKGCGNVSAQHVYRKPGTYTVSLTVTDSAGTSTTVRRKLAVCGAGACAAGAGGL
ncbi:PKD domain-containing protein [Massilia sp. SYSU DXS3249]